jgi:hypothetical protein
VGSSPTALIHLAVPPPPTRAFVGRGEAIVPNTPGMPITFRFVCVVHPDDQGKSQVLFGNMYPETYAEMVALFGL